MHNFFFEREGGGGGHSTIKFIFLACNLKTLTLVCERVKACFTLQMRVSGLKKKKKFGKMRSSRKVEPDWRLWPCAAMAPTLILINKLVKVSLFGHYGSNAALYLIISYLFEVCSGGMTRIFINSLDGIFIAALSDL